VQQSDHSWAEKICGSIGRRDGGLQIGFGFGKYANRNVMDAYGGLSRGVEQWTVRYHPETRRLHQIRDCIVRVRDGESAGIANYQTIITGTWPELGMGAEHSFL
jgi:hypothetical protein